MQFAELVNGSPVSLSLDRACALMAAAFTGVDRTDRVQRELDELARQCSEPSLRGVLGVMRGRLTGNTADYYDVRNSYLDEVLFRGLGLPITLSVVAIEIGRRVDVPVVGVGLPGHFIVREEGRDTFGDPFHNGAVYDRAGLIGAWPYLVGAQPFDDLHLVTVPERVLLIRMLNNLRALVVAQADPQSLYALSVMRAAFVELSHEGGDHARWVRGYN